MRVTYNLAGDLPFAKTCLPEFAPSHNLEATFEAVLNHSRQYMIKVKGRDTPVRCTPIRYTPMRYTPVGVYAHQTYAHQKLLWRCALCRQNGTPVLARHKKRYERQSRDAA